ncbi:ABC-2 transporter permease [Lawsonella clevelandensis]|uniref:Uncharacterized protein n=1 Tax=Lawsonella clevelandensis TaxID=1528099 RepID=A0A0M3TBM7_9ACTN|nr:ABC-2 transporter permease [Lawsonella clevelandensis]ALE19170.1 hypothetical protein AL705_05705 [Lawsonella clevelandensis]ALE34826.1 hypothetical protein IY73_05625 [Lawsonella clevelandensis]MDU7193786.1 ABC-2 transporter permease [Lawsonella clevelandensis]VHO01065.1 hypothetical protein LC603019_01122 [Lawsonella clevelandensis]
MSRRPSLKKSSAAGTTKKAFGKKSGESSADGSSTTLRGLSVFGRLFAMLVPSLIIAAIVAGLGIHLSDSWQVGAASGQSANEEARQELLAGEKAQSNLSRANDAMSAANTSAGLLKTGVDQLDEGAGKLKNGSAQARSGSAELSNGMDQVADGTRQLGSGAKQVAGGVSEAVNGVISLRRYQAAAAAVVDATIPTLVGNDPDTVRTRKALQELSKTLHDSRQTDQAIKDLRRLQAGANEISRQLNPGGAYYSGVMKAQSGSKQLASGLVQLDNGMGELVSGVSKLQGVATTNERNTKKAHTAMLELMKLSNDQKVAQMAEEQLALQSRGQKPSLPLGQAYLVSALLALAAAVAWWSRLRLGRKEIAAVWLLMTVISATAILTAMAGLNAMVGTFMVSTLAVGSAALLLGSGAVVLLLGRKWGLLLNIFLVFVQASVSGFVWLTEWPSRMSRFFDSLMPVSYITSALAAIGNGGDPAMAWLANGALLALTTIAIFVILTVLRRRPDAGIPTDIRPVKVGRKVPTTVTAPASVVQEGSAVETGVFTRVSSATPFAPMDTGSLADLEVATTMPEDGTEDLPTQIINLDERPEQPRDQRR